MGTRYSSRLIIIDINRYLLITNSKIIPQRLQLGHSEFQFAHDKLELRKRFPFVWLIEDNPPEHGKDDEKLE